MRASRITWKRTDSAETAWPVRGGPSAPLLQSAVATLVVWLLLWQRLPNWRVMLWSPHVGTAADGWLLGRRVAGRRAAFILAVRMSIFTVRLVVLVELSWTAYKTCTTEIYLQNECAHVG